MTADDLLRRLISAFDRAGIAYMLTGSFASAYYGASRSTQNIDFVIDATPTQLEPLVRQLPVEHYYVDLPAALEAHRRESLFNVIDLATGWKIDLIVRKARAFSAEEFGRRRPVDVQGIRIFVASPEDVVISKLEWGRLSQSQRQIEDAAAIMRSRWESLEREYLKKWIEDLHLSAEWNSALGKAELSE
jgi:hypothetical protein